MLYKLLITTGVFKQNFFTVDSLFSRDDVFLWLNGNGLFEVWD